MRWRTQLQLKCLEFLVRLPFQSRFQVQRANILFVLRPFFVHRVCIWNVMLDSFKLLVKA